MRSRWSEFARWPSIKLLRWLASPEVRTVLIFLLNLNLFLIINYRSGSLTPWNITANSSMTLVQFSQWSTQCPDLDFEYAFIFMFYFVQSTDFCFLVLETPATLFVSVDTRTLLGHLGFLHWMLISTTLLPILDDQPFNAISRQPSVLAQFCPWNVASSALRRLDYATNIYRDIFIN